MELQIWYYIVLPAVLLNCAVTVYLFRVDDLEPFQRGAQVAVVWLFPFFAAIGIWMFHRNNKLEQKYPKKFGGGPQDSGVEASGE